VGRSIDPKGKDGGKKPFRRFRDSERFFGMRDRMLREWVENIL
jgi:hypothetical protein